VICGLPAVFLYIEPNNPQFLFPFSPFFSGNLRKNFLFDCFCGHLDLVALPLYGDSLSWSILRHSSALVSRLQPLVKEIEKASSRIASSYRSRYAGLRLISLIFTSPCPLH